MRVKMGSCGTIRNEPVSQRKCTQPGERSLEFGFVSLGTKTPVVGVDDRPLAYRGGTVKGGDPIKIFGRLLIHGVIVNGWQTI